MSKPSKGRLPGVNLGLIITPMLDMSFQILAFFIMTYHPAALEAHIPGSRVPGEVVHRDRNNPNNPVDPALDDLLEDPNWDTVQVRVKAFTNDRPDGVPAGTPRQIFVTPPLEMDPYIVADVDEDFPTALRRLEAFLKKEGQRLDLSKSSLKIAADGELRQQYVMMVYDSCKKAGFQTIHFVPPPALNTRIKQ